MIPQPTTLDFHDRGFTLMELAVVMIIIGLMAGMTVGTMKPMLESARLTQTQNKLDAIEDALFAYRVANGRIPCPADITMGDSNVSFGVEAATPGTCTGGSPAANKSLKNAVEGGVPIAALGLPREFAYDAWGSKLVYAVDKRYTGTNAFASYGAPNSCGNIIVKDAAGSDRTTEAMYVLVSHGPNGHGGYNGTGTRISASSANADEQNNCDCDNAAAATAYDRTYVQRATYLTSATNQFDDIVRFKLRWHWRAPDEKMLAGNTICFDGIRIDGAMAGDVISHIDASGDINGDGLTDLVFEAERPDNNSRSVYVLFGKAAGWTTPVDLAESTWWNGINGVRFDEAAVGDLLDGGAIGDVNGDGIDDLIMGARNADPYGRSNAGSVYVYFGKTSGWSTAPYDLASSTHWDGTNGVRFDGATAGDVLISRSTGDVNGDGIADLLLSSGDRYVVVYFGREMGSWSATPYDLTSPTYYNGVNGTRFSRVGMPLGNMLTATGDINGDGIDDIMISAPVAMYNGMFSGSVFAYFGKSSGWSATPYSMDDMANWNGTNGVHFTGSAGSDTLGNMDAGDVNGDGIADIIMGAYGADPFGRNNAGSVYVYFGKSSGWSGALYALNSATHWDGINGVRFDGAAASDLIGLGPSVGDVNGDGVADILLDARRFDPDGRMDAGSLYVYYGRASGWSATPYDLSSDTHWNGINGVRFDGAAAGDNLGIAKAVGDVNGDGIPDMIVSAREADPLGRIGAGSAYLYFGPSSNWPTSPLNVGDL